MFPMTLKLRELRSFRWLWSLESSNVNPMPPLPHTCYINTHPHKHKYVCYLFFLLVCWSVCVLCLTCVWVIKCCYSAILAVSLIIVSATFSSRSASYTFFDPESLLESYPLLNLKAFQIISVFLVHFHQSRLRGYHYFSFKYSIFDLIMSFDHPQDLCCGFLVLLLKPTETEHSWLLSHESGIPSLSTGNCLSSSITTFKTLLKTYLFSMSFV